MDRLLYHSLLTWKSRPDRKPLLLQGARQFLAVEGTIFPLEVKSGVSGRIKSLRVYADTYSPVRVFRTSPRNFKQDNDLINIPLYAIAMFRDITLPFISGGKK